ncbi:hypothetical protein AKJ45_01595 [candidate division MSBL1 archaeon SCGC-AAA261F19]|uniref:Uncharacterized protein n=1 Tax=candidate division MSBL1 archaeon SCGC-AAA261F19 TaxID=1698275 RepID=A0A133VAF0_9EURY|nr:hypothetical protein AKJ45_01595 [candidate division MSBL1 archaeon SCGC-AAA261F19]
METGEPRREDHGTELRRTTSCACCGRNRLEHPYRPRGDAWPPQAGLTELLNMVLAWQGVKGI